MRRPENKGLRSAGVVEMAVLERVPTSTRESFMFLNTCFLDVTLKSHLRFLLSPSTSVTALLFRLPFEASMNLQPAWWEFHHHLQPVALPWQAMSLCGILMLTAGPQLINNFQEPHLTVSEAKTEECDEECD